MRGKLPKINDVQAVRGAVRRAFAQLRKDGFFCRMNFQCCMSCATSAISMRIGELTPAKREQFRGSVYYHRQDHESLSEYGELFIRFCSDSQGPNCLAAQKIGEAAVAALREQPELEVDWDGDADTAILVKPSNKLR